AFKFFREVFCSGVWGVFLAMKPPYHDRMLNERYLSLSKKSLPRAEAKMGLLPIREDAKP
ncbi:MAG TPA: hypothetical protein PLK30_26885, partial [Blastocatellia bacterium]|nr:hypothetical protein [Blastocatellia bacterium]